jgi:hypothetical protein
VAAVKALGVGEAAPLSDPETAPSPAGPAPSSQALSDLRAALDRMDRAARAAGVENDDALGAWIASLKAALECSATIALTGEARVHAAIAALEGAAREDRLRMRQATERCTAETLKLERTFGTMEMRSHNMATQIIQSMANQVAEKMRDRVVIVERQHNRIALWRRAAVLTALVLVIFGVGSATMRYIDRQALELWGSCITHPLIDPKTGQQYCALGPPLAGQ